MVKKGPAFICKLNQKRCPNLTMYHIFFAGHGNCLIIQFLHCDKIERFEEVLITSSHACEILAVIRENIFYVSAP